jgi:hypothetical protein
MKTEFIVVLLLCIYTLPLNAQNVTQQQPIKRPNIIFILTDDQRFDALG